MIILMNEISWLQHFWLLFLCQENARKLSLILKKKKKTLKFATYAMKKVTFKVLIIMLQPLLN